MDSKPARLFHFSEDPTIRVFEPRSVRVPSDRGPGREWLNGPLVWAIDDWHQAMYFFPRDCPRILLWRLPGTTEADLERWWRGDRRRRMLAHVEQAWMDLIQSTRVYRYLFPADGFEDLGDAGMWVSRAMVTPLAVEPVDDLPAALEAADVELRVLPDLLSLKQVWDSSLHASGLRLRNAIDWDAPLPPAGWLG